MPSATFYDLGGGYSLARADPEPFAIHSAIYHFDSPFDPNWEARLAHVGQPDHCFWIRLGSQRIGGLCVEPNSMSRLFSEPPLTDWYQVLGRLLPLLLHWSDRTTDVWARQVLPDQVEHFLRLGFQLHHSGLLMIRPTERFDVSWDSDLVGHRLRLGREVEIAELVTEGFGDGPCRPGRIARMARFLQEYTDSRTVSRASTTIYYEPTGALVGACLVGLGHGWPYIENLVVCSGYRRRGLATRMLKRALTILNEEYPVLRLSVIAGNPAQSVYYSLGFLPGIEKATLHIPPSTSRDK